MTVQAVEPHTKRWTREEYYRLAEEGYFHGQRVQLIEGEIIQMPPMKHPHALATSRVAEAMRRTFGPHHWVREDKPLHVGANSDPEPDIAVTDQPMHTYTDHPTTALMIIEVSDTTVELDRLKAEIYARVGVPEYWILNLRDRQLEVFRDPDLSIRDYRDRKIIGPTQSIAPLARAGAELFVSDLLP